MIYKRIALLALSTMITLSGCQTPAVYNQTTDNIAAAQERTKEAKAKSDAAGKPVPPLLVDQGLYVDKTPISLSRDPEWLKKSIILRGEQLPFSYFSRTVVGNTGKAVLIHYQEGLDATTLTSMNYSGTVKGALDVLAAKGGYVYTINGNNIYWQAFVTKTFDVAFMPGASDYMMGKAGGSTTTSASGATGIIDDSASSQYSSMKGSLSIWKDLDDTLKQLASPEGKIIVSQATTSVTVRDKPANVAIIAHYIANMNNTLSKQVLVKVQVLEVSLTSAFNYGIDWSIVEHAFGGSNIALNANYGTPVSITPLSGGTTPPTFGLANPGAVAGTSSGVNLLINALKQQGRVAVVTEPRVVCLNNQVSAIRIVSQNGYLASVQNTSFGGGSSTGSSTGNSVTSQITPGTLVTGLTLYVLPKIIDHKIFLQVNADLSNSLGFADISSGGATPTTIQVPNVTQKQFNQRSVIGSGDTLILAGFKQVQNQTGAMQLLDSQALGGKAATQSNTETIILITPIILNGFA